MGFVDLAERSTLEQDRMLTDVPLWTAIVLFNQHLHETFCPVPYTMNMNSRLGADVVFA